MGCNTSGYTTQPIHLHPNPRDLGCCWVMVDGLHSSTDDQPVGFFLFLSKSTAIAHPDVGDVLVHAASV